MRTFLILLMGIASVTSVDADDLPHYWLPEIVVTAKRIREPLRDVAVDMEVLSEGEISRRGIRTLPQLFVEEGIFDTRITGIEGGLATVGLRGFSADHVLVMVNGTIVNSPANGTFDFTEIPLSSISRIEIIKGPVSSYYGAYASSGVINIITKKQTEEGVNLEIKGDISHDGAYHGYTNAGFKQNKITGTLFVSRRKNRGIRSNSDFASMSGGGELTYGGFAMVKFSAGERDIGVPGPVPSLDFLPAYGDSEVYSLYDDQKTTHTLGSFQINKSIGRFGISTTFSYRREVLAYAQIYQGYREDWSTYRASDNWYYSTESISASAQVSYQWFSVGFDAQNLEFWAHDTLIDSDTDDLLSTLEWNPQRKNKGIWGSIKAPLFSKRFIPSVSVRWDKNSDYENFVSTSASVLFSVIPSLAIGTSMGTGTRPPTFNELYWPGAGNPELKPQKSIQWNNFVDVSYGDNFFVRISGFTREVKEAISWVEYTPQNIDRIKSRGIEVHPEFRLSNLLSLSLTAVSMKTDEERTSSNTAHHWIINGKTISKRRASYVPEKKLSSSLTMRPLSTTSLTLTSVYTSERIAYFYDFSSSDYKIKRISPVTLFHTCVQQDIADLFTLSLRIDNLFDKEYTSNFGYTLDDNDYPAPGRNISLGLSVKL
jgi:vitamin B12 transporter